MSVYLRRRGLPSKERATDPAPRTLPAASGIPPPGNASRRSLPRTTPPSLACASRQTPTSSSRRRSTRRSGSGTTRPTRSSRRTRVIRIESEDTFLRRAAMSSSRWGRPQERSQSCAADFLTKCPPSYRGAGTASPHSSRPTAASCSRVLRTTSSSRTTSRRGRSRTSCPRTKVRRPSSPSSRRGEGVLTLDVRNYRRRDSAGPSPVCRDPRNGRIRKGASGWPDRSLEDQPAASRTHVLGVRLTGSSSVHQDAVVKIWATAQGMASLQKLVQEPAGSPEEGTPKLGASTAAPAQNGMHVEP